MADLNALYSAYGMKGILPLISKRGDEAYDFFVKTIRDGDLYLAGDSQINFPAFMSVDSNFIISMSTENGKPSPYTFEELSEIGFTHINTDNSAVIKISDITLVPHKNSDALLLVERIKRGKLSQKDAEGKSLYILGLADRDGPQGVLFETGKENNAVLAYASEVFAKKATEGDKGYCYHKIPAENLFAWADSAGLDVILSFGSFTVLMGQDSVIENDYTPDFLKGLGV